MAVILHIETATEVCSVALSKDGKTLALAEEKKANSHSSVLTVLIQNLFKETGVEPAGVDAIAVSAGPGSYTGLRIGVSVAKGLCYALNKPLIAAPTIKSMACGAIDKIKDQSALYCPILNSVKGEVFAALYSADLEELLPAAPQSGSLDFLKTFSDYSIIISGVVSGTPSLPFVRQLYLQNSAAYMIRVAEQLYSTGSFVSLDYFSPIYLKNFIPRVHTS